MNRIERITRMEEALNKCRKSFNELLVALDSYEDCLGDYRKLEDYYLGEQWMKDYEADEAGKLPKDLKRGVLSEDAVYDLLSDHKEISVTLAKILLKEIEERG